MAVVTKKRKDGSTSVQLMFHDEKGQPLYEVKTKQCFAEECDINNIVNRFRRTGVLPPPPPDTLKYGDISDLTNLQDAMIRGFDAEDMFMRIRPLELILELKRLQRFQMGKKLKIRSV